VLTDRDVAEITKLINRYHYYVDRPGFPNLGEIFTDTAILDVSDYNGVVRSGMAELVEYFKKPVTVLSHTCSNILVDEDADGTIRCHSKVVGILPEGKVGAAIHRDELIKTSSGWRIAKRVVIRPETFNAGNFPV